MKRFKRNAVIFASLLVVCLCAACAGKPAAVTEEIPPEIVAVEEPAAVEEPITIEEPVVDEPEKTDFVPESISQEVFDTTKNDVRRFVEELNRIIRGKDYNAWRANLSDNYFRQISAEDHLKNVSETQIMKRQRIVLKSAEDYFNYVVVPSRANSHVDDIEFIDENIVKAFTVNSKNERLRLYELERVGNTWKIIN